MNSHSKFLKNQDSMLSSKHDCVKDYLIYQLRLVQTAAIKAVVILFKHDHLGSAP